jgi:hypothetical protein
VTFEVILLYEKLFSSLNTFNCLHTKGYLYNEDPIDKFAINDMTTHASFYYTWDLDDNELDEQNKFRCVGLADFHMFNLMLLSILPSLASMTTKMYIIIVVQIGREASNKLLINQDILVYLYLLSPFHYILFYSMLLQNIKLYIQVFQK